jgi:hypothetical protein
MDVYYTLAIGIYSILVFSAGIITGYFLIKKALQNQVYNVQTSSSPGEQDIKFTPRPEEKAPFPTGVTHLTDEKDNQLAAQIKEEQLK